MKIRKPKYAELGHFTLLFRRGGQRNEQRFITHVHSYCFAHLTFCLVTFSLPLPSWFAKVPTEGRLSALFNMHEREPRLLIYRCVPDLVLR